MVDASNRRGETSVPYALTSLDMRRIEAYAKRVAAEASAPAVGSLAREVTKTVITTETRQSGFFRLKSQAVETPKRIVSREEVVGDHWILHTTYHNIESRERGIYTEYYEQNYWVLQKDGVLLKVWKWEETKVQPSGTETKSDVTAHAMTEEDILLLDRKFPSYERGRHGSNFKCWGNREPQQIVRHSKGVGVSLALKALLEGKSSH